MKELHIIGRAEKVDLPVLSVKKVPAKIDTGADASSIWASKVTKNGSKLSVVFFGPESQYYDGKSHTFSSDEYIVTRVSSSFGHRELRYKVNLKIRVKRRLINGSFTLSDRSTKLYPILLGRSILRGKFLVDVAKGSPLLAEEKARKIRLKEEIANINDIEEDL